MKSLDEQILDAIDQVRARNHACTAGAVAAQLQLSKSWIVQRCEVMRAAGVVDWTPMAGSLHRVRPEAPDRAERADIPGDTTSIAGGSVPEPATPTAPAAASPVSVAHDITDEIDTVKWVAVDDDHRPSLSEPMKRSRRSNSSGT
jgi:hypothetical protein